MANSSLVVLLAGRTFTVKTIVGKARITVLTPQTQPGKAKIRAIKQYSYGAFASLPTDNTDLSTFYTPTQVTNVSTPLNTTEVDDISTEAFRVHQFAYNMTPAQVTAQWIGITGQAASDRNVVFQVYNVSSGLWETLQTDSTTASNTSTTLGGSVTASFANYFDAQNFITFRAYQ